MATSSEEWSVNSNETTQISFVRPSCEPDTTEAVHTFHPQFTYPIFGFDEVIFGYKGLQIDLNFAAHDCRPHLSVSYDEKFPSIGSTKALDINETLRKYLPASAFEDGFETKVSHDNRAKTWSPPGDLVHQYSRQGRNFEVWAGSLDDNRVRELLNNIQILILFFIEGGQMLQLDELEWALQRWRIYYVFEKTAVSDAANASSYILSGYATTWRFYKFISPKTKSETSDLTTVSDLPDIDVLQLPCRLRISQFLLLPPYQSAGHGSELYQLIYREVMADSAIVELTVEDPSEEFDKLRDANDWKTLFPAFKDAGIKLNTEAFTGTNRIKNVPFKILLPTEKLNEIRVAKKIAPRQFARLTELFLYSEIPLSHRDPVGSSGTGAAKLLIQKHKTPKIEDRQYYWWRVLVRARIFRKNKDVLTTQYEPDERRKHIQDTSRGQQDEYEGLLIHMLDKELKKASNGNGGGVSTSRTNPRKRKVIVEDEDDEEEGGRSSSAKLAKT